MTRIGSFSSFSSRGPDPSEDDSTVSSSGTSSQFDDLSVNEGIASFSMDLQKSIEANLMDAINTSLDELPELLNPCSFMFEQAIGTQESQISFLYEEQICQIDAQLQRASKRLDTCNENSKTKKSIEDEIRDLSQQKEQIVIKKHNFLKLKENIEEIQNSINSLQFTILSPPYAERCLLKKNADQARIEMQRAKKSSKSDAINKKISNLLNDYSLKDQRRIEKLATKGESNWDQYKPKVFQDSKNIKVAVKQLSCLKEQLSDEEKSLGKYQKIIDKFEAFKRGYSSELEHLYEEFDNAFESETVLLESLQSQEESMGLNEKICEDERILNQSRQKDGEVDSGSLNLPYLMYQDNKVQNRDSRFRHIPITMSRFAVNYAIANDKTCHTLTLLKKDAFRLKTLYFQLAYLMGDTPEQLLEINSDLSAQEVQAMRKGGVFDGLENGDLSQFTEQERQILSDLKNYFLIKTEEALQQDWTDIPIASQHRQLLEKFQKIFPSLLNLEEEEGFE